MGNAIGDVLPIAIAMAISPVPIFATLLMIFSKRPLINSAFFLAGWVFTLVAFGSLVPLVSNPQESSGSDEPSTAGSIIRICLGALLLLLAFLKWRVRPKEDEKPQMPNWMNSIESFTPVKSFGVAILLAGINPLFDLKQGLTRHYISLVIVSELLMGKVLLGQGMRAMT